MMVHHVILQPEINLGKIMFDIILFFPVDSKGVMIKELDVVEGHVLSFSLLPKPFISGSIIFIVPKSKAHICQPILLHRNCLEKLLMELNHGRVCV